MRYPGGRAWVFFLEYQAHFDKVKGHCFFCLNFHINLPNYLGLWPMMCGLLRDIFALCWGIWSIEGGSGHISLDNGIEMLDYVSRWQFGKVQVSVHKKFTILLGHRFLPWYIHQPSYKPNGYYLKFLIFLLNYSVRILGENYCKYLTNFLKN